MKTVQGVLVLAGLVGRAHARRLEGDDVKLYVTAEEMRFLLQHGATLVRNRPLYDAENRNWLVEAEHSDEWFIIKVDDLTKVGLPSRERPR